MPLAFDQVNAEIVRQLLRNLVIECTTSTQVTVKSGSVVGADDGEALIPLSSDLTLDITTSGKNGLDTGAEAADTWYYIWLILDQSTGEVAGLLSSSSTSPTLPSGFTKKRLVGAVRNDSSSNFRQDWVQVGSKVLWDNHTTIVTGSGTGGGSLIDLSPFMPVNSQEIIARVRTKEDGTYSASLSTSFFDTTYNIIKSVSGFSGAAGSYYEGLKHILTLSNQTLYVRTYGAGGTALAAMSSQGFVLNL